MGAERAYKVHYGTETSMVGWALGYSFCFR